MYLQSQNVVMWVMVSDIIVIVKINAEFVGKWGRFSTQINYVATTHKIC